MSKAIISGVTAAITVVVLTQLLPDIKRYLRMVRM
ncbi:MULTISPECIES: DUF6893 family small protein [unclassified Streptomyces]